MTNNQKTTQDAKAAAQACIDILHNVDSGVTRQLAMSMLIADICAESILNLNIENAEGEINTIQDAALEIHRTMGITSRKLIVDFTNHVEKSDSYSENMMKSLFYLRLAAHKNGARDV